jgi:hypothetical protein
VHSVWKGYRDKREGSMQLNGKRYYYQLQALES